jgi:hypothetical protein
MKIQNERRMLIAIRNLLNIISADIRFAAVISDIMLNTRCIRITEIS